jgi:hypothetical protein
VTVRAGGRATDADERAPAYKRREHVAHPLGSRDGVELVRSVSESGRRLEVLVAPSATASTSA